MKVKMAIFHGISGHLCIFPMFKICPILADEKCSRVIFGVLDKKKLSQKHVSRNSALKFSVWFLLDLVTQCDLAMFTLLRKYVHRKLRIILKCVPDTTHVIVLTYFHLIRLNIEYETKKDTPNRQTFWLWPDLWRHRWLRGQQHLVSSDKFSRSSEHRFNSVNPTRSFWVLGGGGIAPVSRVMEIPLSGAGI